MEIKRSLKTNLRRETKIYINFRDIFCHTDIYVLNWLYRQIKSGESDINYLTPLIALFDSIDDNVRDIIPIFKKHTNPILDYIEYDKINKCEYISVFSDMYNNILFNNKNTSITNELRLTNIARSLQTLLTDDLLINISIQVDTASDPIKKLIFRNFASNNEEKISILEGNAISTIEDGYDAYFLSSVDYINQSIMVHHDKQVDIVIPEYRPNLLCDSSGNPIKPHKLSLQKSPMQFRNDYNINILSARYPL